MSCSLRWLALAAVALMMGLTLALLPGSALAKVQIQNVLSCVVERGAVQDKIQVDFTLYDDGQPTADTQGNADVSIDGSVVAQPRNQALPYPFSQRFAVATLATHTVKIEYWGNVNTTHRTLELRVEAYCPSVGGIAEYPDAAQGSAASAGDSSGWAAGTYAALAGALAAAVVVVAAGAWYARRRFVR